MSRQVKRREIFKSHFGRLDGAEKRTHRPLVGAGIRGPRIVIHESRKERRNVARAFAAGEWRRRDK